MNIKLIRNILIIALVITIIIVSIILLKDINRPPETDTEGFFIVEQGMTAHQVSMKLEEQGYIKDYRLFLYMCKMKGLEEEMKVGTYELSSEMTVSEILEVISEGKIYQKRVVIPEGMRLIQIASILSEEGIVDEDAFLEESSRVERWNRVPDSAESLEGYLFPDTYEFTPGMDEKVVIGTMLDRFFQVYEDEIEFLNSDELTLHQLVTLASIVEKEAMLDEERPLVSSVFLNRLGSGMKLQSCATVLYGVGKLDDRITIEDLKDDNPYNTYVHSGLPPGPICSPGLKSLKAVVKPADTDYLYFVSKGDGSHHFSDSFYEHELYRDKIER